MTAVLPLCPFPALHCGLWRITGRSSTPMNLITSNPSEIESRLQDLKDGKSSPSQFSILKIRNPGPSYPLISQPNTVGKPFKLPTETVHFSSILKMSSTRYGWKACPVIRPIKSRYKNGHGRPFIGRIRRADGPPKTTSAHHHRHLIRVR